jgi:aspartate kinase
MLVFKFGGASVKDAGGIKNLAKIVSGEKDKLAIVISAFGKTTNALEQVLEKWWDGENSYKEPLESVFQYHLSIAGEIFSPKNSVQDRL